MSKVNDFIMLSIFILVIICSIISTAFTEDPVGIAARFLCAFTAFIGMKITIWTIEHRGRVD